MKKKLISCLLSAILLIGLSGCTYNKDNPEDAKKFKEEYEALNGTSNDYFEYRTLELTDESLMVYSTAEEIVEKMDNGETFIVYFGAPECPWCRSVINTFMETAINNNVSKVYYVDIWDGFHVEILRDTYKLDEEGNPVLDKKGTDAYYSLLEKLDSVLKDYTLTDSEGNKVEVGEKRIFAPNFVYVKDGEAIKLVSGISENQESYNADLTEEVLNDEKEIFNEFFTK